MLKPGSVRPHVKKGNSQSHPGVSGLNPLTHRNTGYQPLPKPLGLPPYHYDLGEHFETIAKHIKSEGQMVLDVLGDSGGVKDAEFQSHVADQMVKALPKSGSQFCYHVAMWFISPARTTITTRNSTKPIRNTPRRFLRFPAIMTGKWMIPRSRLRWTAGWPTSCKLRRTLIPSPRMRRASG